MPTREEILAAMEESARDIKTRIVDVPEWKRAPQVRVAEMSVARAREFSKLIEDDGILSTVAWAIAGMVGDDGLPMFSIKDVHLFDNVPNSAIRRISDAVIELNGLDKSPEDVKKNSETIPDSPLAIN